MLTVAGGGLQFPWRLHVLIGGWGCIEKPFFSHHCKMACLIRKKVQTEIWCHGQNLMLAYNQSARKGSGLVKNATCVWQGIICSCKLIIQLPYYKVTFDFDSVLLRWCWNIFMIVLLSLLLNSKYMKCSNNNNNNNNNNCIYREDIMMYGNSV